MGDCETRRFIEIYLRYLGMFENVAIILSEYTLLLMPGNFAAKVTRCLIGAS